MNDDVKIKGFENSVIDLCNGVALSNRIKYYVLKDITQKLLEASELNIQLFMKEAEDAESVHTDTVGEHPEH